MGFPAPLPGPPGPGQARAQGHCNCRGVLGPPCHLPGLEPHPCPAPRPQAGEVIGCALRAGAEGQAGGGGQGGRGMNDG